MPDPTTTGLRWGLCCQFLDHPVKFRQTTHRHLATLAPDERRRKLREIAQGNAAALALAVEICATLGIGAFRITSQLLPLATHPESGYRLYDLDGGEAIVAAYRAAGRLAAERGIRLSFHPDQFVVLNSERESTVVASVRELDHTAELCDVVGADAMTVHVGGLAGGTEAAIERLARGLDRLGDRARALVALENDDRLFAPADLLPLCRSADVPLVYDVHHHRCRPDGLSVGEATELAAATWGAREPWTHIASPRDGWQAPNPRPHAAYVDPADFPAEWLGRRMTIDVEAKDKERAVLAIRDAVTTLGAGEAGLAAAAGARAQ